MRQPKEIEQRIKQLLRMANNYDISANEELDEVQKQRAKVRSATLRTQADELKWVLEK